MIENVLNHQKYHFCVQCHTHFDGLFSKHNTKSSRKNSLYHKNLEQHLLPGIFSLGMLYLPFYHFLIQHFLFLYNKCLYNALGLFFLMMLYSKKCSFPRTVHNKLVTLNNLSMSNMHGCFCYVQTISLKRLYLTITQKNMGDACNCHKFKRGSLPKLLQCDQSIFRLLFFLLWTS